MGPAWFLAEPICDLSRVNDPGAPTARSMLRLIPQLVDKRRGADGIPLCTLAACHKSRAAGWLRLLRTDAGACWIWLVVRAGNSPGRLAAALEAHASCLLKMASDFQPMRCGGFAEIPPGRCSKVMRTSDSRH